jgi:hypothetical protein
MYLYLLQAYVLYRALTSTPGRVTLLGTVSLGRRLSGLSYSQSRRSCAAFSVRRDIANKAD